MSDVLAAYQDGETLLHCHDCHGWTVWNPRSRGYCPHCGSGDTGVAVEGHDSWPDRSELERSAA